jgi:hypothetical protein
MPTATSATDSIAEFMANGGKVLKGPDPIRVTAPEVLDYLQSCGTSAGFAKSGSATPYLYNGRHITLRKLVEVANKHRLAQKLPPFAGKV